MQAIKTTIDLIFASGLFINGLLMIPQIIKLIRVKNSNNFSIITYTGFNIFLLGMVLHGILQQDFILIIGMGFGLLINSILLALVIYYKQLSKPVS